jgi:ribosome-associated protein
MPRRPFVPTEADSEPEYAPSKTQRKKEMLALQDLGAELLALPIVQLEAIEMDERLREALDEARRITAHGARKRQLQYVGKLLRALDTEPLQRALQLTRANRVQDAQAFHDVEQWRERILAGDDGLQSWLSSYPGADSAQLHALVRDARRELHAPGRPGVPAMSKARRALFRQLRDTMSAAAGTGTGTRTFPD